MGSYDDDDDGDDGDDNGYALVSGSFNYTHGWDLLECDLFDDDTEITAADCGVHDVSQCTDRIERDTDVFLMHICRDACSDTLIDEELTYLFPCAVTALKNLSDVSGVAE